MPEPKKTKRTFAAQTASVIDRIQILEQQARAVENNDPTNPQASSRAGIAATTPEPALVEKLIKFIKTI